MNFSLSKLKNGLNLLAVPIPGLASATLTVWTKTGSRLEEARINGISHFLEHMVFKGSNKRPTSKEIFGAVDAIGGEINAATSKDWTNYYVKARAQNIDKAFDILSDMILNPILNAEEIEREKGVITEEIRMHEDTPMIKVPDLFEQLLFKGSPLGRDIAGTEKSVKGLTRDDFLRYRKVHYFPENMLVTVAGGVPLKKMREITEKYFQQLGQNKAKPKFKEFKSKQTKPQVLLHDKKKEQAHFILGFRASPRNYPGRYAQAVLSTILGGSASSRLFIEVRERRGLAYFVKTAVERYDDTGYISTQAGVDVKRVDEAIKVTLGEHYALANKKKPISKEELAKAKEFLKGQLALSLEDTKDVTEFFGLQALFLKEVLTPEEVFKRIDRVSTDEVISEAGKLFRPEGLNLALIGPYGGEVRFRSLLR
jgi:predicted Zn-dependent peptidase